MKILSIAVPCYNSEAYLDRCMETLLAGGDLVEIIIVDDGSTDGTAALADRYAAEHPSIVRVIHKENGGHGSGVNAGIDAASGVFFKVVDSDDRLNVPAYRKMLAFLKDAVEKDVRLDMVVSNYVYDKVGKRHKFVMKPKGLPAGRILGWGDVHHIRKYHFILMHSIIYRTGLLRECGLRLPEHTFYVDNIYAFQPLPYVRTFWYMDVDLYMYFIGREDQSVSEQNMIKRIDQNIKVVKIMAQQYVDSCRLTSEKACLKYMLSYLEMIASVTCNFLNLGGSAECDEKKDRLYREVSEIDPDLAYAVRHSALMRVTNLHGKPGRRLSNRVYRIVNRFVGVS